MIEIRNLSKSFGDMLVWEHVNLTVADGETLAVIGKSGCGKSVLLKHINALLTPDSGEVYIDGQNIFNLDYVLQRKVRQKFGLLFQGAALFDSIDTFENVAFPLRYFTKLSEKEIREKVMQSLTYVNLEKAASKMPSELSGGMKKRVGLARAIIMEPKYIMYDEPTSGLDPQTADEINELIIFMAETFDVTSIVITHDMFSVLKVADKVAFLNDQKLSWFGTIEEMRLSDQPDLTEFVRASEYQI
ncbi:MAG: ABC transporter ATP-binding protein [Balneolaceae bacterium]|nr:MAG: ABC transporter ATP-binding protein [Balneolaceae bacterium]